MESLLSNRYRIVQSLGQGGFGITYLAEDSQMPSNRLCVVKQLLPKTEEPQSLQLVQERFKREATILEEVGKGHRQIPDLYAFFSEGDQFYLVQEWIEGSTLVEQQKQQGIWSEYAVRSLLVDTLPLLDYIHSKGVIHRDIKPDNIILRASDRKPVLIDFGAVKETMGTRINSAGNSTSSIVIGTPGFMPSEQSAGRPVFSSDLFSLGLTAIYLLTGKLPSELVTDPMTGEIIWRDLAPTVSPMLVGVLETATRSHARDRYPTAQAMLQALQGQAIPSTVASMPPAMPVSQSQTVAVAPSPGSTQAPVTTSGGLSDWQKMMITGSVIGVFVLGAIALAQLPELMGKENSDKPESSNPKTSEEVEPTSETAINQKPTVAANPSPSVVATSPPQQNPVSQTPQNPVPQTQTSQPVNEQQAASFNTPKIASQSSSTPTRISFPSGSYCGSYSGPGSRYVLGLGGGQRFTVGALAGGVRAFSAINVVSQRGDNIRPFTIHEYGPFMKMAEFRIPYSGDYIVSVSAQTDAGYDVEFCAY